MKITDSDYKQRIDSLKLKIAEESIQALIVSEEEDIYYLTGLTYKSLERLFMLVVKPGEVIFILPNMELAHLREVDNVDQINCYWEYPAEEPERWQDILQDSIKGCYRLGLSPKAPYEIASFLSSLDLDVKSSILIEQMRWIKSKTEIAKIKIAAKYCDMAISKLNSMVYFGMSELEVFSIGKHIQQLLIKETDFDYLASNVLVAVWPARISHQPHGIPNIGDVLEEGSHISLAFLKVNGYAAELERTFFSREPSNEQHEIFELMMEARKRSYNVLKAGVVAEEVDLASRNFLEKQGMLDYVMHRTGHGIGLGNHEGPFLAVGDNTILQENMVVSIEPGIYIEGEGGFRHSDTVRITKDGYEILTDCKDGIQDLTFTKSRPLQKFKGKIIKRMFKL